jgi:Xaa-Pro aminopeptidase
MSDLTRILVTGKISPKLERIYGVVLKAQEQAIAAIRPGALMSEVDAAARNVIADAGFGKHFGHGLGHGFGLEIHETTRLAANQNLPLKAGMVITVEPGIYLPGWGGVRIEDDILVTRTGHEVLSELPKALEQCVVG